MRPCSGRGDVSSGEKGWKGIWELARDDESTEVMTTLVWVGSARFAATIWASSVLIPNCCRPHPRPSNALADGAIYPRFRCLGNLFAPAASSFLARFT